MKIKLLVPSGSTMVNDIVDAIKAPNGNGFVYYDKNSMYWWIDTASVEVVRSRKRYSNNENNHSKRLFWARNKNNRV